MSNQNNNINPIKISFNPLVINIPAERNTQGNHPKTPNFRQYVNIKEMEPQMMECFLIREKVEKHQFGYFFAYPVDIYSLGDIDYFDFVQKPMDLNTIGHKLTYKLYGDVNKFNQDMVLMFNNALAFNKNNKEIIDQIHNIKTYYVKLFNQLATKYQREVEINENSRIDRSLIKKQNNTSLQVVDLNAQKVKIQIAVKQYFDQYKLKILADKLSSLKERDRLQIKNEINAKYALDFKDNINLGSLNGEQLLYLMQFSKNYQQQKYGCSQKQIEQYRKGKRITKTRFGFEQQQSQFQNEDS